MYGLLESDPDAPVCVGGIDPDHSLIRASSKDGDGEPVFQDLEAEKLASISVSTIIKRLDTHSHSFQIQQVPRSRTTSAEEEFSEVGHILNQCISCNGGLPRMAIAYDGHGSFEILNATLLGLNPKVDGIEFFDKCVTRLDVSIPLFGCQALFFEDTYPVFGSIDAKHIQKAFWCHIRYCLDILCASSSILFLLCFSFFIESVHSISVVYRGEDRGRVKLWTRQFQEPYELLHVS